MMSEILSFAQLMEKVDAIDHIAYAQTRNVALALEPLNPMFGGNRTCIFTVEDALALIDKLDPNREPGRITFITRMGAKNIREILPALVDGVTKSGAKVLWVCDPMHGNTYEAPSGYKTRSFDDVMDEVKGFFEVHKALGTHPGGVHIELTGDDVTECVGGGEQISHEDLASRYETACDPRLNHAQSLELAFLVAEMLRDR